MGASASQALEAAIPRTAQAGRRLLARPAALALIGVTLFAATVRIVRLGTPGHMMFDEIYYAKAAQQILAGVEVTEERTHPPLSKLIIAGGILAAGDRAFGWRIAGALAGTLLVVVVYGLAMLLFEDTFVAAAAALFMAVDGLVFVESRIAKPDIFLTLFLVASYAAFWRFLRGREQGDAGARWLHASGAAAGAAIATKWTTVVPLASLGVLLALALGWGRLSLRRRDLAHLAGAFVVTPVVLYLLTYIPYFALGHGVREFAQQQVSMYEFHASLTEGHPYQSAWWSWPLLLRPIWYEWLEATPGLHRGVLAIGNPLIWWAGLPAFVALAVRAAWGRSLAGLFVVVATALSYVQYAFITRPLFLYHFLPAVPFLCLALAWALGEIRGRVGSGPLLGFVALAIGWFVAYYPILSGLPVDDEALRPLMWFGTWI